MNRRSFLTLSTVATGVAGSALALSGRNEPVDEAHQRARRLGKPLLVAFLSGPRSQSRGQAHLWSRLLSIGKEEHLALLALCEVVFATDDGRWGDFDVAPAGLLLHHAGGDFTALPMPNLAKLHEHDPQAAVEAELGESLRRALLPDDAALETLSENSRRALGAEGDALSWLAYSPPLRPRLDLVDEHAAFVMLHARRSGSVNAHWQEALAGAALRRLYNDDPPGAQWQCYEMEPCPACGMAIVDARSQVFLNIVTR